MLKPLCLTARDFLFRGLIFSAHSRLLEDFMGFCLFVFIGLRGKYCHHSFYRWRNRLVTPVGSSYAQNSPATLQEALPRGFHLCLLFVLRQCQAPDPLLPQWDYRLTALHSDSIKAPTEESWVFSLRCFWTDGRGRDACGALPSSCCLPANAVCLEP